MADKIYPGAEDSVTQLLFFNNFKRKCPLAPEQELMLAVLADAVECYLKYDGAPDGIGMRLFQDAEAWLRDDDERQPFSFLNVCAALQLDPGYIRRGVFAPKRRGSGNGKQKDEPLLTAPPRYVRRKVKEQRKRVIRAPARPRASLAD